MEQQDEALSDFKVSLLVKIKAAAFSSIVISQTVFLFVFPDFSLQLGSGTMQQLSCGFNASAEYRFCHKMHKNDLFKVQRRGR